MDDRHFFGGDLDAQVAAGDHYAVGHFEDFVDIFNAFGVLDFSDDLHVGAGFLDDLADGQDIRGPLDEGGGDAVHALGHAEEDVGHVLIGERRQLDGDAGHGDALGAADLAVVEHGGDDIVAFDRFDPEADEAVGEQDGVAGGDFPGQAGMVDGNDAAVAEHLATGEDEPLAGGEGDFAGGEFAEAHLRALGVEHEGDRHADLLGGGADEDDAAGVIFVAAVGKIEAGDVHAAQYHRFKYFRLVGTGP